MAVATALVVGILTLLLWLLWRSFSLPASPRLPPGPRPLPILGNLLLMNKAGSLHDFANEVKRQFGPIVTVWMCSKPMVIISGPEIIQEAMIKHGSVFMDRNQYPSMTIIQGDHRAMSTSSGERHRFMRKLLVSEVLSNQRVAGFRDIREREIDILVDSLKKQLGNDDDNQSSGIVTDFRSLIRLTVCNLIVGILFGRRLTLEEYEELDVVMVKRFQLAIGKPRDFMPWLAWLPDRAGVKDQLELRRKISEILDPLIEERKQTIESGKVGRTTLVDTLLGLRDGDIPSPVEVVDSDVVVNCADILNAGTDTTALNLEYCIANLINHPETQAKLAQEISAVVGDRVATEDDIAQLPYLQAVVKEALRRHNPARLAPTRVALSNVQVAGYDIPKGVTVLQHLEGVSLSPEIWKDPLEFSPERFLNKTIDITGSTEITMIPFGVGRRICPAINIAYLHAEIILCRLIQTFEWKSTTPGQFLDLTPDLGLTAPMKYPLVAFLRERVIVS